MKTDFWEEQDGLPVNPTGETPLEQLISRRTMLKGMAATGAFGLFGCATGAQAPAAASGDGSAPLGFTEIPRSDDDKHHVAAGYTAQVLLRQGDPIRPGAPEYNPTGQTGADQERQFGTDCDFISFMPLPLGSNSSTRGLLGVNHENHRAQICFPGVTSKSQLTQQQVEVQIAAQGFSITEIAKEGNQWRVVKDSRYNRRISGNAPMRISGPAAGHPRMRTSADPSGTRSLGTLNNCAGGTTPWGTMLTAEENIQNYFSGNAAAGPEA
ncbi:MAG TPA: alkaline phosphatase PhoX, partial [Burkholderiales bacterium]|nr:alkaline phosphatase PhoX [Burkholderiales bacterium]